MTNDNEKEKIKAAKVAVKNAKFQKLQREINALKKNAKAQKIKPVDLLDAIIRIIDKYPIDSAESNSAAPIVTVKSFEKMKIILILK